MDIELKRRLEQIARMSSEGALGPEAQEAARHYAGLPVGMPTFLVAVKGFYEPQSSEENKQIWNIAELFTRYIIVVYRDAKKQDAQVAKAFLNSFVRDFPGVDDSCLFPRWESLMNTSLAFRTATRTAKADAILLWSQAKSLFQAYNEFLNGLLGFFLIGWRCAQGKSYSPNVFGNSLGAKLNEFMQFTGGEDGAFYLIGRLVKPELRNAIAHGSAWLDTEQMKVKYTDGKATKQSYEMNLVDMVGLAAIGSHLAFAYLAALAAIVVLEQGNPSDVAQLPAHLVTLFRHQSRGG